MRSEDPAEGIMLPALRPLPDEPSAALHAGFVRAHAGRRDSDAEWGAASLAGNVDPHHRVAIADLILAQSRVVETIEPLIREFQPDLVGLSVMTFQRATSLEIARLVHARRSQTRIVVGGYDPSLAPEAYEGCQHVDFLVRGEGEHTLSELLRSLEGNGALNAVAGLSYRSREGFVHNGARPIAPLASNPLRLPTRSARVLSGYTLLGR